MDPKNSVEGPDITFIGGILLIGVYYYLSATLYSGPLAEPGTIKTDSTGKFIFEAFTLLAAFVFLCCSSFFRVSELRKNKLSGISTKIAIQVAAPVIFTIVIYVKNAG